MEWHNILNANDPELDRLAERYKLHPLHIEDCRHRDQNAKIEEGETYIFTVLKALRFNADGLEVPLPAAYLAPTAAEFVTELQLPVRREG